MILADIGEVGIEHEGASYILRPSLFSMSKLGSPREIVELFKIIAEGCERRAYRDYCIHVIWCCTDEDISHLTGYNDVDGFVQGVMSNGELMILAQHLMLHGIVGNKKLSRRQTNDSYSEEFHAVDYVSIAMAHLGVSERDAWNMTMTSLVSAMAAKYPPNPEDEPPAADDVRRAMEAFKEIKKARLERAKNG